MGSRLASLSPGTGLYPLWFRKTPEQESLLKLPARLSQEARRHPAEKAWVQADCQREDGEWAQASGFPPRGLGGSRGLPSTGQKAVPTGSDRAPSSPSVAAPSLTRPCRSSSAPPRPEVLQGEASPAPLSSASPSVPFPLWFQSHKNQEMSSGKITLRSTTNPSLP